MITIATAFAAAATISTTKLCKWIIVWWIFIFLGEVPPMIIFPKRGNEKTHQQNGVDTSKNTTKNVFVIEISRLRRVHFSRNSWQIYAEQLYDVY